MLRHVRYGHEVVGGEWDETTQRWEVRTVAPSLDVRAEKQAAFNQDVQARLASSVWTDGGCRSWYLDPDGNTSVLWPGYTGRFRKALQRFDPSDYEFAAA